MRQRVVLALVLCTTPELIIADEPTTALDRLCSAQIIELIRALTKNYGTSVMLITHDLGVIAGDRRPRGSDVRGTAGRARIWRDVLEGR